MTVTRFRLRQRKEEEEKEKKNLLREKINEQRRPPNLEAIGMRPKLNYLRIICAVIG